MFIDANQDAPYIQVIGHTENIFATYCYANDDAGSGKDQTGSFESAGKGSESSTDAISSITNDPGGAFGGDR